MLLVCTFLWDAARGSLRMHALMPPSHSILGAYMGRMSIQSAALVRVYPRMVMV
jgi:hypothetical protein